MKDTLTVIKERTSANCFDKTHVMSDVEIQQLVSYAIECPTAYNMQNWRVMAFSSKEKKELLKDVAYGQSKTVDAAVTFVFIGITEGAQELPRLIKPLLDSQTIDEASYHHWITMAKNFYEGHEELKRDEAIRSASFAAMTLIYAAQAKGYASGAMIGFHPEGVSSLCQLQKGEIPVLLVAVGKAAPGNWPRKPRKSVQEVVEIL